MASLYTKESAIGKLWEQFSKLLSEQTQPTAKHLFELVLSIFVNAKIKVSHLSGKG